MYCGILGLISLASVFTATIVKVAFGYLGENVTFSIRKILYSSILRKNIGWFDDRENGPSILTSAMASDTSCINGVSTESLSPILDASFSVIVALVIGFSYCW
jgi:ATP-binding cassette subfamily B (MDR/TAP) protein 1